jgi:hypothetical protein
MMLRQGIVKEEMLKQGSSMTKRIALANFIKSKKIILGW